MPTLGSTSYQLRPEVVTQRYTANATWTKPIGAETVWVRVVGGGGAGGASVLPSGGIGGEISQAGGGGAGGYIEMMYAASQLPATVPLVVGAGGVAPTNLVAGNANSGDGGDGGDSSFGTATDAWYLFAGGGTGAIGVVMVTTPLSGTYGGGGTTAFGSLGCLWAATGESGKYGRTLSNYASAATYQYGGLAHGGASKLGTGSQDGKSFSDSRADSGVQYGSGGGGGLGSAAAYGGVNGTPGGHGGVGTIIIVTTTRIS